MNRPATLQPAAAVVPVLRAVPASILQCQSAVRVSSPHEPAEREAEATATKIMRMQAPAPEASAGLPVQRRLESPYIARFASSMPQVRGPGLTIARRGEAAPNPGPSFSAEVANSQASGAPLPAAVRGFMEPRFGADLGNVRVHTTERSAALNRQVSAQAFTVGNHIFFGKDRFQPDTHEGKTLIAHELTHTIQQGSVVQNGIAVQREAVPVSEQTTPHVQRLGVSDALDYFADAANAIPGYRMFTILLGINPINMQRVERSAANILRAVVEFLPGGALITRALDNYGVFERAGAWVEQQLQALGITGSSIRAAITSFLDSLGWRDIFRLGSVWDRARRIFTDPIDRILSFVRSLFGALMRFIKEAILRPIAELASRTRGWDLLCAVLGRNPITGEDVPRTAETLIGGFMRLIGQEELWQNIQRGNAIGRAWAWFQGALGGLLGFVRQIPGLFLQALASLTIEDIVLLPRAFARVAGVFGDFIVRFVSWAGEAVWNLLEIVFSVVAPNLMVYLRRAAGAIRTILNDPIRFARNLIRVATQGFGQFASNFLTHLRGSLIGWLTGAMSAANIYIPQSFELREIVKFVLSVLGLTWQNIRQKLVRVIGETAVGALETGFDIVRTLVTEGPAAAWERIRESLSNLREMVMEQIMTFVKDRVVTAAVTTLLSLLSPVGAFIQSILATYNTVMFFVERAQQIAQVAATVIDSLAAIAAGSVSAAANRVEQTLAGMLTLVISFLARIARLGRVSDAITNVVDRVRQPIDRALDRVVEWIVAAARRVGRLIVGAGVPADPRQRLRAGMQAANAAVNAVAGRPITAALVNPLLSVVKLRFSFQVLEAVRRDNRWWIRGVVNPEQVDPIVEPTEEEVQRLDNGRLTTDERRVVLTEARGVARNNELIARIVREARNVGTGNNTAVLILRQFREQSLEGAYKLVIRERNERDYGGRVMYMDYVGAYQASSGSIAIGRVRRGGAGSGGLEIGFGYVKPIKADEHGEQPVESLALDFLVPPEIESAGVRGVGTDMFQRAAQRFRTQYRAVVGEWYRADFYARGGRRNMSTNLMQYIEGRRMQLSPAESVRRTFTYRRVRELYGGAELTVTVREFQSNWDNLQDGQVVEAVMRPST